MTDTRDALKLALEALELARDTSAAAAADYHERMKGRRPHMHRQVDAEVMKIDEAISVIRVALAAPQGEPAFLYRPGDKTAYAVDSVMSWPERNRIDLTAPLYASPPSRAQAPLTDDTKRLDWIEAQWRDGVHIECCAINTGLTVHGLKPACTVFTQHADEFQDSTVRSALDKAISHNIGVKS